MDTQTTINEYAALIEQVEGAVPEALIGIVIQQIGKDKRMRAMQEGRRLRNGNGRSHGGNGIANGITNGDDQSATENQIGYLKRLGEKVPRGLTKAQASKRIDEAKLRSAE